MPSPSGSSSRSVAKGTSTSRSTVAAFLSLRSSSIGDSDKTGTKQTFKPDHEIFSATEFSYDLIASRLRELSFLNAGFVISLVDARDQDQRGAGRKELFEYKGGIREFVEHLNKTKEPVHNDKVVHIIAEAPSESGTPVVVEVALQWNASYAEQIFCYTNNVFNKDGGTHLTGFRTALTRVFNNYGNAQNLFKDVKSGLSGEDVREGLTAVVSVKMGDPSFDSQTKSKLVSSEVKGIVETVIGDKLGTFFEENPGIARKIIEKSILAAKAREAARKAREVVRKGALDYTSSLGQARRLPVARRGRQPEIYIVEGESAGGTAKQGRDPEVFRRSFPLKGKDPQRRARQARQDAFLRGDRHAHRRSRLRHRQPGAGGELRHSEAPLPPDRADDRR